MRKVNWSTYKTQKERANRLERQCAALEQVIVDKTGVSSYVHGLVDFAKANASSPRSNVKFVNISAPSEA